MNPRSALPHSAANSSRLAKAWVTSLAMCAALHWPGPASASPVTTFNGTASIGNLRVSVVDLDLNDGVAAGYAVIDPNGHSARVLAGVARAAVVSNDFQEGSADWWSTSLHAGLTMPNFAGQADISAGELSARLNASGFDFYATAYGYWAATAFGPGGGQTPNWLLAPNTRLIFTADAHLTTAFIGCTQLGCYSESLSYVGLGAHFIVNGQFLGLVSDSLLFDHGGFYDGTNRLAFSDDLQRTLTITLDNRTNTPLGAMVDWGGHLHVVTDATAPTDVPEPSSLALISLGIAALWRMRATKPKTAQAL